jgi:hypothetical protein
MKLNYLLSSSLIIIILSWTNTSFAQSNTYNRMLNTASKVVRGKIVGSEEVRYDYDEDNKNIVCGQILDIEVTESFKGGNESFRVFASNNDMLIGEEYEYFIIARRNNNASDTPKLAFINCFDEKSTRMDVSYIPYLATSLRQQIFPIVNYKREDNIVDPDTRVAKKGEWLLLVDRIANNTLPYTIARRRFNNGNDDIIEEMRLADFLRDVNIK